MSDIDTFTVSLDYIFGDVKCWQWTVHHHGKGQILAGTTITKSGARRAAKRAISSWLHDKSCEYIYREQHT